ncbi:MAG: hypothetical protein ABIL74_07570 [candidate division WOR-3 bacterium]
MKYSSLLILISCTWNLIFSGCAILNRGVFGPTPNLPAPYHSQIEFKASGERTVDYEILGEGYGESSGFAILGGLLFIQEPDAMAAYEAAVKSKGGDILLDARMQFVTTGFLSPIIFTQGTIKIWGLVAKIKK